MSSLEPVNWSHRELRSDSGRREATAQAERLIERIEARQLLDREVVSLIQTLLKERSSQADQPHTADRLLSVERLHQELLDVRASLAEERRLSRIIREERDALAVQVGQLLTRA